MTALPKILSPEDFLAGEVSASERHEYVNGVAYAMAGETIRHSRIVVNLYRLLLLQLAGKPCELFHSDTMIKVETADVLAFFYPDASIICDSSPDSARVQESPKVLFEVLSPSTRHVDEGKKLRAYLSMPSLAAYVLIDAEMQKVTVWQRVNGQWAAMYFTQPEDVIRLDFVGCDLKIAELYQRVVFE